MSKPDPNLTTTADRRKARLAEALRDNLARRKVRSKAAKSSRDAENETDREALTGINAPSTDPDGADK